MPLPRMTLPLLTLTRRPGLSTLTGRDGARKLVQVQHGRATVKPAPAPGSVSQTLGRHDAPTVEGTLDPRRRLIVASRPSTVSTPVVLPVPKAGIWIAGTLLVSLLVYYFIGIDQGAVSVFGADSHVHE